LKRLCTGGRLFPTSSVIANLVAFESARRATFLGNLSEAPARAGEQGMPAGFRLPALDRHIDVAWIDLDQGRSPPGSFCCRIVVPEPPNGSSTRPPTFEQSRMASAISRVGLTVG
jgi:hypothetical protein